MVEALNFSVVDPSWQACLKRGLATVDPHYLQSLVSLYNWLPGPQKIFNAFSLPLSQVNYVLFGESPYPRQQSANGYAFWDNDVHDLWSAKGLSKQVNRATSLRNIIKMLLITEDLLTPDNTTQEAIANLDKSKLVQTNEEFFNNLLKHGFLLLNTSLVLQEQAPMKDAKAWAPFMSELLDCLLEHRPEATFILFGKIANTLQSILHHKPINVLCSEHPYNLSFITNPDILDFFRPLHLLRK